MCINDPIFNFRVDLKEENYEENNNDDAQLIYREIIFLATLLALHSTPVVEACELVLYNVVYI